MNDRYLFKAKRIDNGEWVVGSHVYTFTPGKECPIIGLRKENHFIVEEDGHICIIDPSTLCKCTGLKDKNGILIWENDVVSFEDAGEDGYEYKEGFDFINRAKVEFAEGRWSLTDFASDNSAVMDEMYNHAEFMKLWCCCEVIGNVFDNPELLEVEHDRE